MPKKPYFESAVHHLLLQAKAQANRERQVDPKRYRVWEQFVNSFRFEPVAADTIRVTWTYPTAGSETFSIKDVAYYTRGDTLMARTQQSEQHMTFTDDVVRQRNDELFARSIRKIARKAGMPLKAVRGEEVTQQSIAKIDDEEKLSDRWAESVDVSGIDVIRSNTVCTVPELRFLHSRLGDISGLSVLDLGCGLGEASVYFALRGARVTSVDLSKPMLGVVERLAARYSVKVKTVQASVEQLSFPAGTRFDIVYVGNVFHHVDIPKTLAGIKKYLKPGGRLILWEPMHYNPVINVYRKIATQVRSHDERPFTKADIAIFRREFPQLEIRWFWLTTLLIFVSMAIIQRRDPNTERYWKAIIKEADDWAWLYLPLERLDRWLLRVFPFLGLLCWNVAMVCRAPATAARTGNGTRTAGRTVHETRS